MPDRPQLIADVIFESKGARDFANNFGRLLSDAAKQWRDDVKKTTSAGIEAGLAIALASGKSGSAIKGFVKSNIGDVWADFMKEFNRGNIEEAEKLERILEKRTRRFQKEADSIAAAFARMQDRQSRTFTEHTDQFKDKVQFLQRGLFGGAAGLVDLVRGGGEFVERMGKERQGRAKRMRALARKEGADPGDLTAATRMAKMGRAIATIGKAAVAFGAVAGAVLMLIKLFADLEAKIKDMNKELIGTAGASQFGLTHAEFMSGKLTDQLERMRDETTAINRNFMAFRASAQEQQRILAGFNRAGLTYARMNEEIEKGTKFMGSYSDITALALTYARNLGMESTEVTEKMGAFAFETGMGLRDVAEQFSIITREAMLAGFVTKRFYAAVVEVTSGMSFYGFRIEETTKLLKTFDSLLGEAVGTKAFQQLVGQYKDKAAEDRIRELIIKDQDFAQQQFASAFERQIRQLGQEFGTQLGMDPKEIRDLLAMDEIGMTAELQRRGLKPEEIARFRGARLTGRAAEGGLGAMTRAMPFAGPGFEIAMAAQATRIFGGKRIDEVLREAGMGVEGAVDLKAVADATGKSIEQLEWIAASFTTMEGHFKNLRDIQKKMAEGTPLSQEDKDLLDMLQKKFGMYIDESSRKIMKGDFDANERLIKGTGVELQNVMQAVTETTTLGEEQIEEQMTRDQEIAKEISQNITGLTDVMQQTVLGVLNDIYDVLVDIRNFFLGDPERAGREAGVGTAEARREQAEEDARTAKRAEQKATERLQEAQKTGDRKQIELAEKNLKEAQAQTKSAQDAVGMATAAEQTAKRLSDEEMAAVGGTFKALVDAQEEATGQQVFLNESMKKSFGAVLEQTLPSLDQSLRDLSTWDLAGRAEAEIRGGLMDPKDFAEEWVEAMKERPEMVEKLGGMEEVERMAEQAQAQMMKQEGWGDMFWSNAQRLEFAEAFAKAIQAQAATAVMTQPPIKARDLILPAGGGRPIITDVADTVIAARPGGPLANLMGGGGAGTVNVSVYGGDQRKVYETVMRALKATGNA